MRDLRRRALESNKTVSRKAQSRGVSTPNSRTTSAHSSRQSSRNVSRHPSDDEDDDDDDTRSVGTAWRYGILLVITVILSNNLIATFRLKSPAQGSKTQKQVERPCRM